MQTRISSPARCNHRINDSWPAGVLENSQGAFPERSMTKTWELISMPQGRNVGSDLFISTSWDSLRSRLPDPASSPVRLVNAGSQGPQILPRRWRIGRGADLQNRLPIHIGPLRPSAFPETSGIALPLLSNRRVSDRYGRYKRPLRGRNQGFGLLKPPTVVISD